MLFRDFSGLFRPSSQSRFDAWLLISHPLTEQREDSKALRSLASVCPLKIHPALPLFLQNTRDKLHLQSHTHMGRNLFHRI